MYRNMTSERVESMRRRYPPGTEVTLNSMEGGKSYATRFKGNGGYGG